MPDWRGTAEDDAYVAKGSALTRRGLAIDEQIRFVEGDQVRDWLIEGDSVAYFPTTRPPVGLGCRLRVSDSGGIEDVSVLTGMVSQDSD